MALGEIDDDHERDGRQPGTEREALATRTRRPLGWVRGEDAVSRRERRTVARSHRGEKWSLAVGGIPAGDIMRNIE